MYALLKLAGLSQEELKKLYRKAAKKHHPDRGGDPEKFKEVAHAFDILGKGKEPGNEWSLHKAKKVLGVNDDVEPPSGGFHPKATAREAWRREKARRSSPTGARWPGSSGTGSSGPDWRENWAKKTREEQKARRKARHKARNKAQNARNRAQYAKKRARRQRQGRQKERKKRRRLKGQHAKYDLGLAGLGTLGVAGLASTDKNKRAKSTKEHAGAGALGGMAAGALAAHLTGKKEKGTLGRLRHGLRVRRGATGGGVLGGLAGAGYGYKRSS